MKEVEVKTQAELEKVCKDGDIAVVRAGVFYAYGSSQVTACDSSQVRATPQVPVTIHGKDAKVKGGVQIKYKGPKTAAQWLKNYGVKPVKGIAILYKIVRDDFKSQHGLLYEPGTSPSAPDWDGGKAECGGGLHFCPAPALCIQFDSMGSKFIGCPIKVSEIVVHENPQYPTKVKAPRVYGKVFECDINGNPK